MFFGLLRRENGRAARRAAYQAPRFSRPQVEPLEGRLVPAAIRNLPGFLVNNLPANDDLSTGAVNLGFMINFFGVHTSTAFLNNNGNITLNSADGTFTPFQLTGPLGQPIIAPFFADVDTLGVSSLMTYGQDTLCGHQVFGVDWVHVNYYNPLTAGHVNKFDSFQLILIDRSDTGAGNFDIEFNYNTITWETGDASGGVNGLGGTSAAVGYSNGSGAPGTNFQLTGSQVNGAFLDGGPEALASHSLNAATPGRYNFQVRNGQVVTFNVNQGVDISDLVSVFHPLRYLYSPSTQTYRGNVTVLDSHPGNSTTATDACLDEVSTSNTALNGNFQLTLIYRTLPPGVTLVNATGVTASGHPYITTSGPVPFIPGRAYRFAVVFRDPFRVPISTFLEGPATEVFAGPFDPSKN